MKKLKKLSDKEIKSTSDAIARTTFDFMKRKLTRQLDNLYKGDHHPDYNDIVNITTMALAQLDTNMLILTRKAFETATNSKMNFSLMMHYYMQDVMSILEQDERKQLKEKMN